MAERFQHTELHYEAPAWLPGGHAQTIVPATLSDAHYTRANVAARYTRERWDTPDGDFVDVDFAKQAGDANQPFVLMFHGLEGSSASHYARAFLHWCEEQGMGFAVAHARGCSGEINRAPRAYHSGDWEEIDWIVQRLHARLAASGRRLFIIGISLGGNALLRWSQERGDSARDYARAMAAICSPLDLTACSVTISRGFNRLVYTRNFFNTMIPNAMKRLEKHPGLFNPELLKRARNFGDFDNIFTAPLHGFNDAYDYWARCSAKPHLHAVRVPTLLINPLNDPFLPRENLPLPHEVSDYIQLWQPATGGHVGFASGTLPWGHVHALPQQVGKWFLAQI